MTARAEQIVNSPVAARRRRHELCLTRGRTRTKPRLRQATYCPAVEGSKAPTSPQLKRTACCRAEERPRAGDAHGSCQPHGKRRFPSVHVQLSERQVWLFKSGRQSAAYSNTPQRHSASLFEKLAYSGYFRHNLESLIPLRSIH